MPDTLKTVQMTDSVKKEPPPVLSGVAMSWALLDLNQ